MEIPIDDIKELVEYVAFDERANYIESGEPEDHIYIHVIKVKAWLDKLE